MLLSETTTTTMSDAISTLVGLVPNVMSMISANPVLMVFFCAPILGIAIGVLKRLK